LIQHGRRALVDSRLLVGQSSNDIAVRTASVVSGEKCRKDTPGEARFYGGGGALLVLDLTLATFSLKKTG